MQDFRDLLPKFDKFLTERGLFFHAIVIGGAAMQLLGLTERVTKDCDVLSPKITVELKEVSKEFAKAHGLAVNWLNNGPETLIQDLPPDWQKKVVPLYEGTL